MQNLRGGGFKSIEAPNRKKAVAIIKNLAKAGLFGIHDGLPMKVEMPTKKKEREIIWQRTNAD